MHSPPPHNNLGWATQNYCFGGSGICLTEGYEGPGEIYVKLDA